MSGTARSMRYIATAVGVGLSIAALSTGSTVAATPRTQHDPYPAVDGWRTWNYDFAVPAGSACDAEVRVTINGHIRFTVNGQPEPDDYQDRPGDVARGQTPDMVYTVTNTVNQKKIKVPAAPMSYRIVVSADLSEYDGKAVGKNVFFAPGVRGILWADGVQRYTFRHVGTAQETLDIHETTGRVVELCHRLGATAVQGKAF